MSEKLFKIGVDVRPLQYPYSGIGRYTKELVTRLIETHQHQWFLYSDAPITGFDFNKNITVRYGCFTSLSGRFFTTQVLFSQWARQDNLDVFWSPRHHLPLFLKKSIPSVVTIHDLVWDKYPETMTRLGLAQEKILMARSVRRAGKVIAVSNFTKQELLNKGLASADEVEVIYSGSSMGEVTSDTKSEALGDYFLFVGTLEPRKNLEQLLIAYKSYQGEVEKPIKLIIVGSDGWGDVNLKDQISSLQLSSHVKLLGKQSERQLASLYQSAYYLVMPSVYEGFGLPVAECMQYGVPAIVSKNSAMEEIGGNAVVLVNPHSIESISRILITAHRDKEQRKTLSLKALERANFFDWDKATAEVMTALQCEAN